MALVRDPLHERAREHWGMLQEASASLHTSIPVVIETFTFLERNARRDVALAWRDSLYEPGLVKIHPCDNKDLATSWDYFKRRDLHKLSAVDATSFAIMTRLGIRIAFAFDHHFAAVGFRMVG
ncbi:MAG: PIN domain-containing protein [Alphaproteobacteria bacterium]|nr:PIN domain-containing protein [Alphaproteobacteria bacterium]